MAVTQEEVRRSVSPAVAITLRWPSLPRLGVWLAGAGWVSIVLMWLTRSASAFGHDQQGIPATLGFGLFLVGWTVMVAAMMLPSSLPTLGRVDQALPTETRRAAPRFMAGYFFAWAAFGAVAFTADGILHLSVDSMPWLAERSSLIVGGIAMFAGAAELLGRAAPPRFPTAPPGASSFSVGKAHAVDRIRRCWPLMLFAMAVGMTSPVWMVGLTLLMVLELRPRTSTALRLAGLLLFGLGLAVIVEPDWLPVFLGA